MSSFDGINIGNNQQVSGNNNQTNQVNGDGNQITNVFNPQPETQAKTIYQRQSIKPLSIANKSVSTWWFILPGAIGFIANILQIVQFLSSGFKSSGGNTQFMTYFMLVSMLLIVIGVGLRKMKYLPFPLLPWIIEIDRSQRLYLTRIGGTCGKCGDRVTASTKGPNWQTQLRCVNNSQQHVFEFDRALLPDVGDDYQSLQQ